MQVSTGGKHNEKDLTDEQFREIKEYAISLGMPGNRIYYVGYDLTAYGHYFDLLRIGTDVLPVSIRVSNPNCNISWKGVVAHEIVGHREAALKGRTHPNPLLEEIQASVRAARFTPDLRQLERFDLIKDAIYRLRKNGLKLHGIRKSLFYR